MYLLYSKFYCVVNYRLIEQYEDLFSLLRLKGHSARRGAGEGGRTAAAAAAAATSGGRAVGYSN